MKAILDFLYELVIYLLLPFLGWLVWDSQQALADPVMEWQSFTAEPVRLLFVFAVLLQAAFVVMLNTRLARINSTNKSQPHLTRWRNITLETILVVAPFSDHGNLFTMADSPVLRFAGLLLYAGGIFLILKASYTFRMYVLGKNLDLQNPPLVTSGLFHSIRFPIHLGGLVFSLGLSLLFRSWIALGAFGLMFCITLLRIREEEHEKALKYRSQWALYARQSWRLIPRIY